MDELSVFVDESGNLGRDSKYYILTLVFHDQSDDISAPIRNYELALANRNLPNEPFHFVPLTHGNGAFGSLSVLERARFMSCFASFAWHVPFYYKSFIFKKAEFRDREALAVRMKRDLIIFLFDRLQVLQKFNTVKLYYDDGQRLITNVLHTSFEYVLGNQVIVYREADPRVYRLFQLADFVCGIERVASKYEYGEEGSTEKLMFGVRRDFLKSYIRKLRKHAL